jgi:hypothetical protein
LLQAFDRRRNLQLIGDGNGTPQPSPSTRSRARRGGAISARSHRSGKAT